MKRTHYSVLFRWNKNSESNVAISGSFNSWGECIPLQLSQDVFGRGWFFSRIVEIPKGIHVFKFLVDGEWKYDPEIAFTTDDYGNINNLIEVKDSASEGPQYPTKSILRDSETSEMNPEASEAVKRLLASNHEAEYDLPVQQEYRKPSPFLNVPGPKFSGLRPIGKSKSDLSLSSMVSLDRTLPDDVPREMRKPLQKRLSKRDSSSVLLAASTHHFGGDLVTQEHETREKSGGHRSILSQRGDIELSSDSSTGKLIIFLVGLPGRGKTFIGHILCRHLTWMNHPSKLFNVGQYRRNIVGSGVGHDFWDPLNQESYAQRGQIAQQCLEDAFISLEKNECSCAVFDATNCTLERRELLQQTVRERGSYGILFIESIINDPEIINSAIHEMKMNSEDYRNKTLAEASEDYHRRINHYSSIYQPLSELEECGFIKVIDAGKQIFCNNVFGYLQSRIVFLMANFHLHPRPIWLSRHGQSNYNVQKKIGGDSGLSPLGMKYAEQLDRFIQAHYPAGKSELCVWTSTMKRTGMTVQPIMDRGRSVVKWKQLDEIDAGICDGMTYVDVSEKLPEEYIARSKNKLHYRYPRGESYQDVIHRLEPVITELMRQRKPILIVAHQAILRVLYGYLTNKSPSDCPTIDIPLHKVIQVTPKAYRCEEVWHCPM